MSRRFTIGERDGKWTLIDAEGQSFYSLGVNCVTYQIGEDMEMKLAAKYGGAGWFGRWAEGKYEAIRSLGFNTLAAWHMPYYRTKPMPKTVEARMSRHAPMVNGGWAGPGGAYGFPDVFDPVFEVSAHRAVVEILYNQPGSLAGDETLIGWYTDNELHWWGSGGQWGDNDPGKSANDTGLVDDYIRLSAERPGKKAWVAFLQERYGTIEALNEQWGAEYTAFDDLLWLRELRANKALLAADKLAFLRKIAEMYFGVTSRVLRQYDATHLNLGCRMVGTGTPEVVFEAAKDVVDVFTFNFYSFDLPEAWLERVHRLTGKPQMITEFSFAAGKEAGFDLVTNGAQKTLVRNQTRRGECYRSFVLRTAELPFMVGTHWFALYDYTARNGLIGNYGLYDREDNLWAEFAEAVRQTHDELRRTVRKG
ncbi:alpha-amylase family protein [Paenibacillus cymbidii]|uniref:hypothetical protein n=1 Tax=Paenibacillus cymbidii TaxID=1639034 RepID=UPI001080C20A|nr:hypothetical protein [Paenibacillus cymbidii]